MATKKQYLTFISYSRRDKEFALHLATHLKAAGFSIWLDQLDIPTGARWDDEIEKALEQCDIFMVILTPRSIISNNVKDEIGFAIDSGKHILPVLLENAHVPLRLRRLQYVDFTNKSPEEGIELAKQLLTKLIEEPSVPNQASNPADDSQVDRTSELKADASRLARQRADAIRRAREQEQLERSAAAILQTPSPSSEKIPPQTRRPPGLALMVYVGIPLLLVLCLGGGWAAWPYIIQKDTATPMPVKETPVTYPPIPTTKSPITDESATSTPTETRSPTVTPTPTPTATSTVTPLVIPSNPVEFVQFYFDNINNRNYDLTWYLLSEQYKAKNNQAGKKAYEDFWNQYKVTIYSKESVAISDTSAIVTLSTNIQDKPLYYYLIRDNTYVWLFDPIPSSLDVTCKKAPRTLSLNSNAVVVTDPDNLLLRDAPTDGRIIEELHTGNKVRVIGGPQCKYYKAVSAFFWWWKVQSEAGNQGWIVEGYDSRDAVFIQPAP